VSVSAPAFGNEIDRAAPVSLPTVLRHRLNGNYPIDPFGADPELIDVAMQATRPFVRVRVEHADRLPAVGGALLVANRSSLALFEPTALAIGVRQATGRRLRVIGAPDVPIASSVLHKLGALGSHPEDAAALLRAGHLAAAPLAPSPFRPVAGEPPRELLSAILGFPVFPVVVLPGGPFGLPLRRWRVVIGEMIATRLDPTARDSLAAAELAERVRDAVDRLLRRSAGPK